VWTAAASGRAACVRYLVEQRPPLDISYADGVDGLTPEEVAKRNGHDEVRATIRAELHARGELQRACLDGEFSKIAELVGRGFSVLAVDPDSGMTPLHAACLSGSALCVVMVTECGAVIDAQDRDNKYTPLALAARAGDTHSGIVAELLSKGADRDLSSRDGVSPIAFACRAGALKVVHMLTSPLPGDSVTGEKEDGDNDKDDDDDDGNKHKHKQVDDTGDPSPAEATAGGTDADVEDGASANGAIVPSPTGSGGVVGTADDSSDDNDDAISDDDDDDDDDEEEAADKRAAVLPPPSACDVDAADELMSTPLHHAAAGENCHVLEHMFPLVKDKEPADWLGSRPLHLSCLFDRPDCVKFLLEQSIDVAAPNNEGATPELVALAKGHTDVAMMCRLEAEARIAVFDSLAGEDAAVAIRALVLQEAFGTMMKLEPGTGRSLLHLAATNGDEYTARML